MIYNKKFLCSVLLPYSKHFYFSPELDYKSKQTSQINEVKMKLSIPLILHIISEFWPCRCFFLFLTNGKQKINESGIPCSIITLTSYSKCFTLAIFSAQIPISWTLVLTDKESDFLNFISVWESSRKRIIYNILIYFEFPKSTSHVFTKLQDPPLNSHLSHSEEKTLFDNGWEDSETRLLIQHRKELVHTANLCLLIFYQVLSSLHSVQIT